jgi:hypothetical protein
VKKRIDLYDCHVFDLKVILIKSGTAQLTGAEKWKRESEGAKVPLINQIAVIIQSDSPLAAFFWSILGYLLTLIGLP